MLGEDGMMQTLPVAYPLPEGTLTVRYPSSSKVFRFPSNMLSSSNGTPLWTMISVSLPQFTNALKLTTFNIPYVSIVLRLVHPLKQYPGMRVYEPRKVAFSSFVAPLSIWSPIPSGSRVDGMVISVSPDAENAYFPMVFT